jgi:hypothetical protein
MVAKGVGLLEDEMIWRDAMGWELPGRIAAAPAAECNHGAWLVQAFLGRERVILMYQGELEIPSDIHGVVYLKFNNSIYVISERIRQRLKGVGLIS